MWDAIVAGAGPAGATAAYVLARKGWRVLLADRVGTVAHKVGEALPGAAVRLLRTLDLPAPEAGGPHATIAGTLTAWDSDELAATDSIRDPYGPGWRLDRARFDADLRRAAQNAGAVLQSLRIVRVGRADDVWHVQCDDGTAARARWLIDASGRAARVARNLGARRMQASRLIATYRIGQADPAFTLSRTLIEATRDGWWYAARLPSGAAVAGFHTAWENAARIRKNPALWEQSLASTRHVGPLLASARFDTQLAPLNAGGACLDRVCGDGWIACGDAVLSFDPISGQGIFSALYSGMTAATAISQATDEVAGACASYAGELENVWRIYLMRCQAIYGSQRRWPDESFWSARTQAAA